MMRTSTLLWRMIRLLGQNAGLLSNALEVGKRLFVDDRWPAAPCLHPDVSSGSILTELGRPRHVRFTPYSNRIADIPDWQLRANSGRRHTRLSDQKADAVAGECQVTLGIGRNRRSTGE